jgi:hypothetical protein
MDYVAYEWFTLMFRTDGDPRPQYSTLYLYLIKSVISFIILQSSQ